MKNYDPENESSYIMYLDANNFYGWAMSQPLPYRNFRWQKLDNVKDWISYINNKNYGIARIY